MARNNCVSHRRMKSFEELDLSSSAQSPVQLLLELAHFLESNCCVKISRHARVRAKGRVEDEMMKSTTPLSQ